MAKEKIKKALAEAGGEVFIVGGAVRDELLGIPCKDIDFLIRKLDYSEIKDIIQHLGKVFDQEIGGKVSTLKAVVDGEEFDIAIPRIGEKSTGSGHGDFEITLDPHASVEEDLARRDFTFNALAKSHDGAIVDKFGGLEDLERGLVRAVGDPEERFKEDPLRILRALQFATRLGFELHFETAKAIESHKDLLLTISGERILMEFEKAWTKGHADVRRFASLLRAFGIGKMLFGEDFNPSIVSHRSSHEEKVIASFVGFFLKGGNAEILKPTNNMMQHLNSARCALAEKPDIWSWAKKEHLIPLFHVFSDLEEEEIMDRLIRADSKPMEPKELDITGQELMELGFKGKMIGEAQRHLLRMIHNRPWPNVKQSLIKELKTLL